MITQDKKLMTAVNRFVDAFELVFETDWEHSKACLQSPESFQCEKSFLLPDTTDEANNWCNRKALLSSYREVVSLLMKQGLRQPEW